MTLTPAHVEHLALEARTTWNSPKKYQPNFALPVILGVTKYIKIGTCHIILPDGQVETFRGALAGPEGICLIHNDRFAWKFLIRGILGFCEAHLNGDWSSPDMTTLFEVALRNEPYIADLINGSSAWRWLEGALNKLNNNTKRGSKKNIAQHYDLGNDFYAEWLDESMTYSSALFDGGKPSNDPLQTAQNNKYAKLASMLDLRPHHHVLEIGCGWGGFAEYAAGTVGCKVTGLTISKAQYDFAKQRITKAGLNEKVDIQLCDYRDATGQYDRVASIEMFEAVGEKYWDKFFEVVRDRLHPGGMAAMQVITIAEKYFETYRKGADYIQKYIFPGGLLPTFSHLNQHIAKANMEKREAHPFGDDYARTLAEWRQRFLARWPHIKTLGFDERFRRMWEQYLCYCEAGFIADNVDVYQFSFVKPK